MTIHGYYRPRSELDEHPTCLEVEVLKFSPESVFQLSVQPEANKNHSIIRGVPIPGTDFCGAYVIDLLGNQRSGSQIYDGTWTTQQHISKMTRSSESAGPPILGFVGAGNITMNPGFVGLANNTLFYVRGQSFAHRFKCLEFGAKGATFRETLLDPDNPPSTVGLSGPMLVENGHPIQQEEIELLAASGQFYDLRHIIQFPSISWPRDAEDRLHIHVGLNRFWKSGELQPDVVVSALRGAIMAVDLTPYTRNISQVGQVIGIDIVREELLRQGYRENSELDAIGDFHIKNHELLLRYFPGIYNHSIIGTDRSGYVVWLGIRGFGNSLGLTMTDTAVLAAEHMHNAILVDNGGDVMCRLREEWILPSAYDRNRIRALILFSALKDPIRQSLALRVLPLK